MMGFHYAQPLQLRSQGAGGYPKVGGGAACAGDPTVTFFQHLDDVFPFGLFHRFHAGCDPGRCRLGLPISFRKMDAAEDIVVG